MTIPFQLFLPEFMALFLANGANLISPGAGFVITSRNSIFYSRKAGVVTGIGIVCSSFIHKNLAVLGYGLMIKESPKLGFAIQALGCLYLLYLSFNCFRNAFKPKEIKLNLGQTEGAKSYAQAFRMGFFTDLLNPQASICFMFIIAATVSPETPLALQLSYVAVLLMCSIIWYSVVAYMFSIELVKTWYLKSQRWFEMIYGSIMLYLSFMLVQMLINYNQ